jgi:ABC-type transport system involved in multi-copper enzyme maturation permease subunit
MIQPFFAVALNGFREARRNRVTVVLALFALAMLLSSTLVTDVTVHTFDRVLTDLGLGVMSSMLALLAIFLSSGLLSREIERRSIFLIVSKPISRGLFLVGRLAGNMMTLTVLMLGMTAVFVLELNMFHSPFTRVQMTALGVQWVELFLLTSLGFVLSSFSSQIVSGAVTTGIYFAGHLSGDIYELSRKSSIAAVKLIGKAIYYTLPNLSRLNFRPNASYAINVPSQAIAESVGYGLAYAIGLVVVAIIIFSRRDFK